jgi:hypothetical protein
MDFCSRISIAVRLPVSLMVLLLIAQSCHARISILYDSSKRLKYAEQEDENDLGDCGSCRELEDL